MSNRFLGEELAIVFRSPVRKESDIEIDKSQMQSLFVITVPSIDSGRFIQRDQS